MEEDRERSVGVAPTDTEDGGRLEPTWRRRLGSPRDERGCGCSPLSPPSHLPRPLLASNPLAHRSAMARMPGDDGYYSNALHHIQAKQSVVIPNHRPPSPTRNLQDRQAPGVRPSALFALAVHLSHTHEPRRSPLRPHISRQMTISTSAMRIPVAIGLTLST